MTPEEIQQIFFVECEESLEAAETGLAACREGTQDADTINGVFRAVHSIKGGAGAFGFTALQAYTHTFETLLSDVRDGSVELTGDLVDLLLIALDTLSDHVRAVREGGDPPDDAALLEQLSAAQAGGGEPQASAEAEEPEPEPERASEPEDDLGIDLDSMLADLAAEPAAAPESAPEPEAEAESKPWQLHLRTHAGAMRNGGEPLAMLRELAALGGECLHCDSAQLPALDALDPAQGYLGWTFALPGSVSEDAVRDIFEFFSDDCDIAIGEDAAMPPVRLEAAAPPPAAPSYETSDKETPPEATDEKSEAPASAPAPAASPAPGQSIRIDLAKLDRLIDSVGELVIAQAMMAQRLGSENISGCEELAMLEGLTRDIQESAMAIRAQPIGSVFSRVPRILRELSASTGKHVRLQVSGEATELDKTVIERLGEPLTHLIRNAVDHGIESAEERLAAGKDAEGTLSLSAEHRSGRILIRIADDGRGIDREAVFAKAVEKGIVAPDAQLAEEEIDHLIFAPGFSTAKLVTSVSGRGVGMDVVRQNVKDLGGRITIESAVGKGTSFTLTLPLTLAISDGMIVTAGQDTLVVPLAHVVESLKPGPGDIHGLGTNRQVLNVRGRFIPVLPICPIIGGSQCANSPADGVLIVVDTETAGQAALLVDDICDQRQFVIKSLDTHYRAVEGISGATILGDGRVALILDVDGLVTGALASQERLAA